MRALAWMKREHDAIARMLVRLEAELADLARSGTLDVEAFERLLEFFERRVDGQHQEGEERAFLPVLVERAPRLQAALAVDARAEHRRERMLLAHMRAEIEGAAYDEPCALGSLAGLARQYVALQRAHARWEEVLLYAIARRALGAADDRAILAGLRAVEREHGGPVEGAARALERWLDRRKPLLTA
jgi:hemerythrin-like domain-containing protein